MSVTVLQGDCREVMAGLPAGSFDAIVTDPPYHLTSIVKRFGAENAAAVKPGATGAYVRASRGFMGKTWDGGDVAFQVETWAAALRVLKPGGYLVAFAGTRNSHRMICAIEDAGFEIRDSISYLHDGGIAGPLLWCYGAGFPKSHDVSKKLSDARCLCDLQGDAPVQASLVAGAVLQQDLCGDRKEDGADDFHLCNLQQSLEADNSLSGHAEQDVLTDLCGRDDFSVKGGSGCKAQNSVSPLRRPGEGPAAVQAEESDCGLLQPVVPGESQRGAFDPICEQWPGHLEARERSSGAAKSCLEGGSNPSQSARKLRSSTLRAMPFDAGQHGAARRVCDGAPSNNGAVDRAPTDADGVRSSPGSSTTEQRQDEPGAVAGQSNSQAGGAWPRCERCGKPRIPSGLGTALKPAHEPICLARKPLCGTVAENVLEHGTGAINIDGCRIAGLVDSNPLIRNAAGFRSAGLANQGPTGSGRVSEGRWPANVIHDGSDEVLGAFAAFGESKSPPVGSMGGGSNKHSIYGDFEGRPHGNGHGDAGTAARFFYSAKADATDRLGSKHPTVKPVDLMRYLIRLVTPPGGHVLDCFAGSGTTGMAAMAEGFDATLIEREAEYVADIQRRIAHVSGADSPLFASVA